MAAAGPPRGGWCCGGLRGCWNLCGRVPSADPPASVAPCPSPLPTRGGSLALQDRPRSSVGEAMVASDTAVATVAASDSPKSHLVSPQFSCYLSARSHDSSFDRIQELAEPEKTASANEPRLVWGNQETVWTLTRGAVTARPSSRTVTLAKPKKDFGKHRCRPLYVYSCGRESTIWERPPLVDFGFPSDRLLKLSEPKQDHAAYLQQRPHQSSQWPVSPAALNCKASLRILELARPKAVHPDFMLAREVPTQVTHAAISARASSRLQCLAEPRVRKVTCCYDNSFPESVIRPVSKLAQNATASPRILELARAKPLHPNYIPLRDAEWPVTKAAQHAVATPRLVELAQPCKRPSMNFVQLNLDAFTVKESAKKATCSARIQELARPIKR